MPLVGNISGSNGTMKVAITGSLVIADLPDASFPSIDSVGTDARLFVSGTRGGKGGATRGVSVFGGDTVVSGAIYTQDGIGAFSPLRVLNDIALTGSFYLTASAGNPGATESAIYVQSDAGLPVLYAKNGTGTAFKIAPSAASAGVAGAVQFSNGSGGFSADASNFFWDSSNAILKIANLEVTGTTFVVTSSNVTISDPVILIGSGSKSNNSKSIIAFASGTAAGVNSVVFGPTADGSNGISAAQLDVQNGNLPYTSISLTNLVPVRASKFEVENINNALTSSGGVLMLSGTSGLQLQHQASPGAVDFKSDTNTYFRATRDGANNSVFDARSNKAYFSGSQIYLIASSSTGPSVTFALNSSSEFMEFSSGSNSASVNIAKVASRTGTDLALDAASGRKVIFSANNTAVAYVDSNGLLPAGDKQQTLGSQSNRWSNIYTGDLHLRNERGDYTLIEEEDCLTIRFNKTGKRYKFVLEPAPEFDEK